MRIRKWTNSEITESFDLRQQRLLDKILEQVRYYYDTLYQLRNCYQYPLSLARLMRMCNCSGTRALMAVRVLAHSYDLETETEPPLYYERVASTKNPYRRVYRIFLRSPHGANKNGIR